MSSTGYVFVDESGNHTADDCYVVTGCCCVSSSSDPGRVLQPTRDRVLDFVADGTSGSSPRRELKGTRLGDETLDSVFSLVESIVHDDATLDANLVSWVRESPVRFVTSGIHGDIGRDVLSNYMSAAESHRPVQVLSLARVLNPVVWTEYNARTRVDRYHVVLDAPTWKAATEKVERAFDRCSWIPDFEFTIADSQAIPGIQIADMAAHARRVHVMTNDCARASRKIDEFRM